MWVHFELKAETTCKPIIKVDGTFVLDTNVPGHPGISVRWVNPATAMLQETWCTVAAEFLSDIAHYVTFGIVGEAGNIGPVQQDLTAAIMKALPDPGAAVLFLDGTYTLSDELFVNLKIPTPSIEIHVPYDVLAVARTPTLFPAGQVLGRVAHGLGMRDNVAAVPQVTMASGPNGVPLNAPTSLATRLPFRARARR
jgi:hypothetical protein